MYKSQPDLTTKESHERIEKLSEGLSADGASYFAFKVNDAPKYPTQFSWDDVEQWADDARAMR